MRTHIIAMADPTAQNETFEGRVFRGYYPDTQVMKWAIARVTIEILEEYEEAVGIK